MKTFKHQDRNCIDINGKSYFLVRGYCRTGDSFLFVQVTGFTPLRKEDMPNKDWTVMSSRKGEEQIWTAYRRPWFQYQTEREGPNLAFVGASTEGSYYLALKFLEKRYGLGVKDDGLLVLAEKVSQGEDGRLNRLKDSGNTDVSAVTVELGGNWHWGYNEEKREEEARLLFKCS